MSFDRFLLAFESRDLSQADKRIIRVSSFPKLFLMIKLFGTWQFGKIDVLVNLIIQKFARLKSEHFRKFRPQLFRDRKRSLKVLSFCQLEIDHVTQQPKEIYQRTSRRPKTHPSMNECKNITKPRRYSYSIFS